MFIGKLVKAVKVIRTNIVTHNKKWNNSSNLAVQKKQPQAIRILIYKGTYLLCLCVPMIPSWLKGLRNKCRGQRGSPPESCTELQRVEEGVERTPRTGVARQRPVPPH